MLPGGKQGGGEVFTPPRGRPGLPARKNPGGREEAARGLREASLAHQTKDGPGFFPLWCFLAESAPAPQNRSLYCFTYQSVPSVTMTIRPMEVTSQGMSIPSSWAMERGMDDLRFVM